MNNSLSRCAFQSSPSNVSEKTCTPPSEDINLDSNKFCTETKQTNFAPSEKQDKNEKGGKMLFDLRCNELFSIPFDPSIYPAEFMRDSPVENCYCDPTLFHTKRYHGSGLISNVQDSEKRIPNGRLPLQ